MDKYSIFGFYMRNEFFDRGIQFSCLSILCRVSRPGGRSDSEAPQAEDQTIGELMPS